jgi:hypothetical protein
LSNTSSDAAKGVCTGEGGYIAAAEIREIIGFGQEAEDAGYANYTVETWHDGRSNSDIMVYDGLEWVAWMSDATKRTRSDWYQELGFGGTPKGAVDLDRYGGAGGVPQEDEEGEYNDTPFEPCERETPYETLEDLRSDLGSIPGRCRNVYISWVLQKMLDAALAKYNDMNNGVRRQIRALRRVHEEGGAEAAR